MGSLSKTWCLTLSLCLSLASDSFAQDKAPSGEWPQWRGPQRNGLSSEMGLLKSWPTEGPPLVWKTNGAGEGYSTVSISQGRLFTMGNRGDGDARAEYVIALDVATGKELWAARNGSPFANDRGGGPRGTPTVDGDVLYALGGQGELSCLQVKTGQARWHLSLFDKFGGRNNRWGISESPLLEGDWVICNAGGPGASIVALDRRTGELVWKTEELSDRSAYSSAIAADVDGMRQILHFTARGAVGVSARDGKFLWRYDKVANKTADIATPIFQDNLAFFSSAYGTGCVLLRLRADSTSAEAAEVYFNRDMRNHHSSCVLVGDHLYGFSDAVLTCMEFKTGKVAWQDRSVGKGSLIYADGHLYCFSERGVVGLIEATPGGYREKGRFKIEPGQWPTWSHPVVAGGRLYLRDQDTIYCFDVQAK